MPATEELFFPFNEMDDETGGWKVKTFRPPVLVYLHI